MSILPSQISISAKRGSILRLLAFAILLLLLCSRPSMGQVAAVAPTTPHARFTALAPRYRDDFILVSGQTTIPGWSGSFSAQGKSFAFRMVGTDPARGSLSTTVPTFLIPVKITLSTHQIYDPGRRVRNTLGSVTQNLQLSPLWQSTNFSVGTVSMGFTQYLDAFQRASLWNVVSRASGYHVLLGSATLLPSLNLTVPAASGSTISAFSITAAYLDINYLDAQLQQYLRSHPQITPGSLPVFVSLNTYLHDSGGCCIGGYHSATGQPTAPQTYVYATYVDRSGAFAEDISALSHEIGEWMEDPFVSNNTPCGILEDGDPVVGRDFSVNLNGITYHPEDLVFLSWFAMDKPSHAANGWYSFRNSLTTACK